MVTTYHIIITLTTLGSCHPLVQPRKCCPQPLTLDTSDPTYPLCVRPETPSLNLSVDTNIPARLPNCKAEYEVHPFGSGDAGVGRDGALVTNKYGEDFEIVDFCVDQDVETEGLVAVTCDACKEKVGYEDHYENAHTNVSDTMCQPVLSPWLCIYTQP